MHRQVRGDRCFLERIGFRALLFRRDVNGNDVIAALGQCLKHRFAERLLSVHDNTHRYVSLRFEWKVMPLRLSSPARSARPRP